MKKIILPLAAIAFAGTANAQSATTNTTASGQVSTGTTTGSTNANTGLGADVSATAQAQREADDKGIGAEVSTTAKVRNDTRADTRTIDRAQRKTEATADRLERKTTGTADRLQRRTDRTIDDVATSGAIDTAVSGRGALAISQGERALLGELLGVVFSQPPARARGGAGGRLLERITERLGVLRPAGAPVDPSELTEAERGLLARLAGAADDAGPVLEFRTGRGKVRRAGDGKLLLPRDNAAVRAAVRAADRDPAWLYPAAVALLGGHELPAPEVRRQWYARLDDA